MNRDRSLLDNNQLHSFVKGMLSGLDVQIVNGTVARYDHENKTMTIPDWTEEPADPQLAAAWHGLVDLECARARLTDYACLDRHRKAWKRDYPDHVDRIEHMAMQIESGRLEAQWSAMYPGAARNLREKSAYLLRTQGDVTDPAYEVEVFAKDGTRKSVAIGPWNALANALHYLGNSAILPTDIHRDTMRLMRVSAVVHWQCMQVLDVTSTDDACAIAGTLWRELATELPQDPEQEEEAAEQLEVEGGMEELCRQVGGAGWEDDLDYEWEPPSPNEIGGVKWGEMVHDHEVIASQYLADSIPPYTVHPKAREFDKWIRYDDPKDRAEGRRLRMLLDMASAGPVSKLRSLLVGALDTATERLVIGNVEDGEELDPGAIPLLATGYTGQDVYTTTIQTVTESTGVCVLVDCSGSMGSSEARWFCPTHGEYDRHYHRGRRTHRCPECNQPMTAHVSDKAGYAAVTANALHNALKATNTPHAVLGYTTCKGMGRRVLSGEISNRPEAPQYRRWSRTVLGLEMHEFVPAPGVSDTGDALPFITGRYANLDGESVLEAAQYAFDAFSDLDRIVMCVIADGLPAGADDQKIEGPYLKQAVQRVAASGIQVIGIGVSIYDEDVFAEYYPNQPGNYRQAPISHLLLREGEGLSQAVLQTLTWQLTAGIGGINLQGRVRKG